MRAVESGTVGGREEAKGIRSVHVLDIKVLVNRGMKNDFQV